MKYNNIIELKGKIELYQKSIEPYVNLKVKYIELLAIPYCSINQLSKEGKEYFKYIDKYIECIYQTIFHNVKSSILDKSNMLDNISVV